MDHSTQSPSSEPDKLMIRSWLFHKFPRSPLTPLHICILILGCLIIFGNYYCYDIPAALNIPLRQWLGTPYEEFQWQLNLLYATYSLPNICMPLVGGYLVDRLGSKQMVFFLTTLILIGNIIFAAGVQMRSFAWMVVGRIVGGVGGESLEVAGTTITTEWFQHVGYVSLALGINLSASRLATSSQDSLSPLIVRLVGQEYGGPAMAAWVGAIFCAFSLISGLILIRLDSVKNRQRAQVQGNLNEVEESTRLLDSANAEDDLSSSVTIMDYESWPHSPTQYPVREPIPLRQNRAFWFLCAATVSLYGTVMPFIHISSDFLQSKWGYDVQQAGMLMGIPDALCALGTPLIGLLVDHLGHPGHWLPGSALVALLSHILLHLTQLPPVGGLILLGIASSMASSTLWPCVPLLVDQRQLGSAYGSLTVALNLALAIIPLVIAHLRASSTSFQSVGIILLLLSGVAMVCTTGLLAWDAAHDRRLNQQIETIKRDCPDSENEVDEYESDTGSEELTMMDPAPTSTSPLVHRKNKVQE